MSEYGGLGHPDTKVKTMKELIESLQEEGKHEPPLSFDLPTTRLELWHQIQRLSYFPSVEQLTANQVIAVYFCLNGLTNINSIQQARMKISRFWNQECFEELLFEDETMVRAMQQENKRSSRAAWKRVRAVPKPQ